MSHSSIFVKINFPLSVQRINIAEEIDAEEMGYEEEG